MSDKHLLNSSLIIFGIIGIFSLVGLFTLVINFPVNSSVADMPTYSLNKLFFEETVADLSQVSEVSEAIQITPEQEIKQALDEQSSPPQNTMPETAPPQQTSDQIGYIPEEQLIKTTASEQTQQIVQENVIPEKQFISIQESAPSQLPVKKQRRVEVFELGNNEFLVMVFDEEAMARGEQQITSDDGIVAVFTDFNGIKGYGFKAKTS